MAAPTSHPSVKQQEDEETHPDKGEEQPEGRIEGGREGKGKRGREEEEEEEEMHRTMISQKYRKKTSKTLNPHALPVTMVPCSDENSIHFPGDFDALTWFRVATRVAIKAQHT